MTQQLFRRMVRLAPVVCLLFAAPTPLIGQSGAKNGEWRSYAGDGGSTRYSPLDQINATNFNKLEVAWRFKTDNLGPRPEFQYEGTPLMANGVLYATAAADGPWSRSIPPPVSNSGCTASRKVRAPPWRRGSCRAAVSRTGPTAGRSASCT